MTRKFYFIMMSFTCLIVLFFAIAEVSYTRQHEFFLFMADRLELITITLLFIMFLSMVGLATIEYMNKRS